MIEGSSLKDAQTLIKTGVKKLSSVSNVPRLEAEILLSNLLEINPIKFHTNEITVSQRPLTYCDLICMKFNWIDFKQI